jgi:hypothetical protein
VIADLRDLRLPSCVETGAPTRMACPPSPVPAACAPSARRSVAVCAPPLDAENRTR